MVVQQVAEGFSVSHAQVLDGATLFADALTLTTAYDIYGVEEASIAPNIGDYENNGDDVTLSNWSWTNYADLSVKGGYFSFPLVETLTGRATVSTGVDPAVTFELDLWHEDDSNVAPMPALVRIPSRDSTGVVRLLDIGLYKVDFEPIRFDGPSYKNGLKVSYQGRAVYSSLDELGVAFVDGKRRIGKIISLPTV